MPEQPNPTPAPEPQPPAPPASPPVDPQEYQALLNYVREMENYRQTVAPHAERIARLVEDPEYAEFADQNYEGFKEARKRAKEGQLSPGESALYDRIEKKISPALEFVDEQRKALTAQQQRAAQDAYQANLSFSQRLVAEQPHLKENNFAGMQRVARYAVANNLSVENAWKDLSEGIKVAPSSPPTSLRSDAATPGVPGKSDEKEPTSREEYVAMLSRRAAKALRAQGA